MPRKLDIATLDNAARDYARQWGRPDVPAPSGKVHREGPSWVLESLYNATFKDEHDYLVDAIKAWLSPRHLSAFEVRAAEVFKPRSDETYAKLLKDHLAIDPDGNHIPGAIGSVQVGTRFIKTVPMEVKTAAWLRYRKWCLANGKDPGPPSLETIIVPYRWPVYAGEMEERQAGSGAPDELPPGADPWPLGEMRANAPTFSAESIIAAVDAIVDRLDEGTTAATLRFRTGTKPADPDAAETGTLLATLTFSDPAFGAAVDDADGTVSSTASAITDDTAADATGTATYARAGATGTGADDHIDLEVGASGSDINMNTVSFVSGSTVSVTSMVVNMSQGGTAT